MPVVFTPRFSRSKHDRAGAAIPFVEIAALRRMTMKKMTTLLAFLMSVSVSTVAYAHPDHEDTPTVVLYKVELASKKDSATFNVTRDGEKVSTVGASGKLILTNGKSKQEVALTPSGDNAMTTAKAAKMVPGTRARAMITFADKTSATEDFVLK
jgi:hypothetical protein